MRKARWIALGLLGVVLGCSRQDPERLARLGARVGQKAEAVLAGGDRRFLRAWQPAQNEGPLDARLTARLSGDKLLAKQHVRAQINGAEVQLLGKVENAEQRRRAVQLAEETVGVEKVVDRLEGP